LRQKETYFLKLKEKDNFGIGECALFRGLSVDDTPDYEHKMQWLCDHINEDPLFLMDELRDFPSIQFGLEQALLSLKSDDIFELFPSDFSRGNDRIAINGLIWMGEEQYMLKQIQDKLNEGFTILKLKIGAIDFETELKILSYIRQRYGADQVELRVDANGAFEVKDAMEKLKKLAEYELHSIEQPVNAGQWEAMSALCEQSPVPIALDEELIGIIDPSIKKKVLSTIKPQYIILKPSLIGGFKGSEEWIKLAREQHTGWWVTSALESNIGLNAIAQFTYTLKNQMPQGLGTGELFTNNMISPLTVNNGTLFMNTNKKWGNLDQFLDNKR
jgi:o-succinylbenzoate synthase